MVPAIKEPPLRVYVPLLPELKPRGIIGHVVGPAGLREDACSGPANVRGVGVERATRHFDSSAPRGAAKGKGAASVSGRR